MHRAALRPSAARFRFDADQATQRMAAMYPDGDGPRRFRNVTQFIVGQARR